MELSSVWAQFLLQVLVGTVAGGVTNAIAVWMLFHPYERRYGLHGAIPKNKARLARSIGRTVGERLLTPADLLTELNRTSIRETLDEKLGEVLSNLLEKERGSLGELLPAAVFAEVERTVDEAVPMIVGRLESFVESGEFEERVRGFVARTREEMASQAIGNVLTAERRADLTRRATAWAEELAASPELERGVREYLDRHATELLASQEPLLDKVPAPVVRAVEGAIDAYLPLAVGKLGEFLHQPAARERIRDALHELFQRFVDDLRFHERVIARLVVTERTFDKALDSIERDGVEQLAALLDDPVVRDEISRTIHDAVIAYLRKPISEMVGDAEGERASALVRTTGDYLLRVVRDERTRSFLVGKLNEVMERAESRTWGDLVAAVDDATVARWIVEAARSPRARDFAHEGVRTALRRVLEQPIGRPGRWLPADAVPRLAAVISPALWDWMQTQLPTLVERLNVQEMVERKVLSFSTQRVEEIIRGVTAKELDLIVRLGYVLGAFIGLTTFAITRLFPR